MTYSYNYDILCAACHKPRYFGYTDLPDSEMCICKNQSAIPSYDRKLGELPDEALLYASEEDWTFYWKAIEGLPTREGFKGNFMDKDNVEIPYSSGPHVLRYFREALAITKQHSILEIGFNLGHGAAMLLELDARVDSIDVSEKWETKYSALYLKFMHEPRFAYWNRSEFPMPYGKYGLVFIDGAHDEENIIKDIELAARLEIPYLLLDDWYPKYGETQKAVAKFPELELVKDMNNLRLYKVNY